MKLSLQNLERAKILAGQRVFLTEEHRKLTMTAPMVRATARVVFQPLTACKSPPIVVEISENKHGDIARAILDCMTANVSERIAALDAQLAELGIEIEDAA